MNGRSGYAVSLCFWLLMVLAISAVDVLAQTVAAAPPPTNQVARLPLNPPPLLASLYFSMATSFQDYSADAIACYRGALRAQPDSPAILNDLAWLLCSDSDARNRNGTEAVALARRACELTQYQESVAVGTLAAACAEAGQFADACKMAETAISLDEASHQMGLAAKNRRLLKLYEAGKPYREAPPRRGENLVFGLFLVLPFVGGALLYFFARFIRRSSVQDGWLRLVLGNLLVLIFLLSWLPLAGETYYRFIYNTTSSLNFTKVSNRWFKYYWHLNPSGCRDNVDYFLKIKPGLRRITFVGDSFAAGHGIKNVEDRFSNRLRRMHPEWEIHLLAQLGYDTGDELEYLKECLDQGYQIDQVVLVYCLNDVSDLFPEWGRTLDELTIDINDAGWLRRNSCLVNTLYYQIATAQDPNLKNYYQFIRDGYDGPIWEQQKQRLKAFRDLVQSHGGRLSVVTFPFVGAVGPHYEYQSVHDALGRCWRELGVPHLDLLPVYKDLPPGKITVNRQDPHPNAFAHQLATPVIDQFLAGQLGPPPPSP